MPTRQGRKPRKQRVRLHGSLWLSVDGRSLAGHGRIGLLRAVADNGSLTRAAQAFGMSYKGAWNAINTMNELSGQPLVERVTGGRGGGYTQLTEHGRRLVERYEAVDEVHERFVRLLDQDAMDLNQDFSLLRALNVKTSARNQWVGTIDVIRAGAVNDEVQLVLANGARLTAIITHESTEAMRLRVKQTVIALAKSTEVILATDLEGAKVSARNRLEGTVATVALGAVNAEVTVTAEGGLPVAAIVPLASVEELGLKPGVPVTALVKSSDIVLATTA